MGETPGDFARFSLATSLNNVLTQAQPARLKSCILPPSLHHSALPRTLPISCFQRVSRRGKESRSRRESGDCSQRSQLQQHQSRPRVTPFSLFGKQERQSHILEHCYVRHDLNYTPSGLFDIQTTLSLHIPSYRSSRRNFQLTAKLDLYSLCKRTHGCQ